MPKQNPYCKRQQQHASASRITPCCGLKYFSLPSSFNRGNVWMREESIILIKENLSHPPLLQGRVASRWAQSSHSFALLAHLQSSKGRLSCWLWGCSLGKAVKHSAVLMATLHAGHKTNSNTVPMLWACETAWNERRCWCRDILSASNVNTCCGYHLYFFPQKSFFLQPKFLIYLDQGSSTEAFLPETNWQNILFLFHLEKIWQRARFGKCKAKAQFCPFKWHF